MLYRKSVLVTVNPIAVINSVNLQQYVLSFNGRYYQQCSNYKYGTTTKYYTTLALANAGAASDITTPAAVATTGNLLYQK
jgi:hypothetical protein